MSSTVPELDKRGLNRVKFLSSSLYKHVISMFEAPDERTICLSNCQRAASSM